MYLGLTPFPISIRNSAIAVAHLVTKTGVKQMFVTGDGAMQRLAREANEILAKDGLEFEVLPMPLFEDLYGPGGDDNLVPMHPNLTPERKSIMLHSSGQYLVLPLREHNSSIAEFASPRSSRGGQYMNDANADLICHRIYCVPEADPLHGQDPAAVGNFCV